MAQERLPMRKIRDVLRLKASGLGKRKIAASLGISATAAGDCLQRARWAGLSWPLPDGLTDERLEARLYLPPKAIPAEQRPQPPGYVLYLALAAVLRLIFGDSNVTDRTRTQPWSRGLPAMPAGPRRRVGLLRGSAAAPNIFESCI